MGGGKAAIDQTHLGGHHPERLPAPRLLNRLDDNPRPLAGGLEAIPAQARDVEQDVGRSVVWNDEAEPLGDVEPFDPARDLYEVQGLLDLLDGLPLGEWGDLRPGSALVRHGRNYLH